MAAIALASVRSCGVTTTAAALLSVWPGDRRLLLAEVDPAGGTLAARLGLPVDPGLVSLAAAARRNLDADVVWSQVQSLDDKRHVLVGPPSAGQASSALRYLSRLPRVLVDLDALALVDRGRVDESSAPIEGAAVELMCVRPELADLTLLASWLDQSRRAENLLLVIVGDGPYGQTEVSDALGVPIAGVLPWDPDGAGQITGTGRNRRASRSPLVRAARTLADELAQHLRTGTDRSSSIDALPPPPVDAHADHDASAQASS